MKLENNSCQEVGGVLSVVEFVSVDGDELLIAVRLSIWNSKLKYINLVPYSKNISMI